MARNGFLLLAAVAFIAVTLQQGKISQPYHTDTLNRDLSDFHSINIGARLNTRKIIIMFHNKT